MPAHYAREREHGAAKRSRAAVSGLACGQGHHRGEHLAPAKRSQAEAQRAQHGFAERVIQVGRTRTRAGWCARTGGCATERNEIFRCLWEPCRGGG